MQSSYYDGDWLILGGTGPQLLKLCSEFDEVLRTHLRKDDIVRMCEGLAENRQYVLKIDLHA